MNTNNPPAAILELNQEQAQFMLKNCNRNIEFAIKALMVPNMSDESLHKLVDIAESFKEIRQMLMIQGIKDDD